MIRSIWDISGWPAKSTRAFGVSEDISWARSCSIIVSLPFDRSTDTFTNAITGWDTTGNMIEHYADGDLVNKDTPVGWGAAGDESLAVWGPEVPKWFLQ